MPNRKFRIAYLCLLPMDPSVVILLTLLACAFFSGIEIAFISVNKLRIELKAKQGSLSARILNPFVKNPSRFVSTTLVGNNVSLVIYSIYMEQVVLHPFLEAHLPDAMHKPWVLLLLASLISTLIILFTAEFFPKVLFRINPNAILSVLAYPFLLFYYLFFPVVHGIVWLSKHFLRLLFRSDFKEEQPAFTKVDLDEYIAESSHLDLDEDADVDAEMFRNALDFGEVKVRECMIHRTQVVAISVDSSMEAVRALFVESGHSKILVYEGSIDHIIGYVHQNSLFRQVPSIRQALISIIITTETTPAHDLLNQFTRNRKSIAVVVDEFGGTAGIVTMEDILEEIFGEIRDEHDEEAWTEKRNSDGSLDVSTHLEVDYLNEKYQLNIPSGDYETLGGYIVSEHESIPSVGEKIQVGAFSVEILKANNNRLEEVRIRLVERE